MNNYHQEEITYLTIDSLQPNPLQPRGVIPPETLMDLVDSIKEHGILEPLVVAHTPAGYQIIAGERRWRAAKVIGLEKVPTIVKETSPQGMLEMALVENVQRTDLNALERAKAFERLGREFDLTNAEIAARVGKSPSYISNSTRLLDLPDALKDGLISGLITEGHARALASIEDVSLMIEAYKTILKESGSVRRAEELARRMKKESGQEDKASTPKRATHIISQEIDKMNDNLNQFLGDKGRAKVVRSQRQTRVNIVLKGSPEETESLLQKIYQSVVK